MSKMQNVRIVEIPNHRAVSSGYCEHNDALDKLFLLLDKHSHILKSSLFTSNIFMWHENGKTVWVGPLKDEVTEVDAAFKITDFEGGLYVVSTANEADPDDREEVGRSMRKWIEDNGAFEMDFRPGHVGMGLPNISHDDIIEKALGFMQQEIIYPIKLRST